MYKKIWHISRMRIVLQFLMALVDGGFVFTTIFFFKFVIDAVMAGKPFSYIVLIVAIRLGYLLFYQILDNIFHLIICPIEENRIKEGIVTELYNKMTSIDMKMYDNSKFYDKISWAINESVWLLNVLSQLLTAVTQTYYAL